MNDAPTTAATLASDYEFGLLRAITRRNFWRMAVPIMLTLAACVIVFVLRDHYGWTFEMKVVWFSFLTLFVLFVLCIWAFLRMWWINLLLERIQTDLPQGVFVVCHEKMAQAPLTNDKLNLL